MRRRERLEADTIHCVHRARTRRRERLEADEVHSTHARDLLADDRCSRIQIAAAPDTFAAMRFDARNDSRHQHSMLEPFGP